MLLSMTGHGESHGQQDGMAISAEVRTINNRYFKLQLRCGEAYAALESRVEAVVRNQIRRGTVHVSLKIDRRSSAEDFRIDDVALASYRQQIEKLAASLRLTEVVRLESLLVLPGVVMDTQRSAAGSSGGEQDWPLVESVLVEALRNLQRMRVEEGRAMADDLRTNRQGIGAALDQIEARAPSVVAAYQTRLTERLGAMLREFGVHVTAADVVREVGVFSERVDISEEIVRLRSHLDQFESIMQEQESSGRKLEFLTQEMLRETNTIGSKANDAEIALHVVEIKTALERIREMIQNVE